MEAPGKYFSYSLTHHAKTHLAGLHSDSNSVPPYCCFGNHTIMQRVGVLIPCIS